MASPTKRVYWDACVWLALILREKIPLPGGGMEDRDTMCRMVIEAAKKGTHVYNSQRKPMNDALSALRETGFAMLRPMTPEELEQTRAFLLSREVYVDAHVPQTARNRGADVRVRRELATGSECVCVHTDDAIAAPHLLERGLEHLDLASEYLSRDPAVAYSANAFWTRPGSAALRDDIQSFHCDQDDVRFLAMFVYLTDVLTDDDGPQDLEGPDGTRRTIYGAAGTVFLADTMRPHRGRKPVAGERGIYWWRWGVSDRPAANEWDKIEPMAATAFGDRYPADGRLRESIRLLVRE